ncbi:terminase small subunit protein [Novosphingobium sp.]|uniref:terminase small subunit-like protein n=1 Tax=Novosphingobium sp. TaxID=1874826 RepID=UPI002FDEAA63
MEICQRIMAGQSVRKICADEHMPAQSTVFEWLARNADFRAAYSLAKSFQAETLADEILEIADDAAGDFAVGEDGPQFQAEHVQRARLRVDSRKWLASKLAPKRYGDALSLRHGSADPGSRQLTQEEITSRLAAILSGVANRKGRP